VSHKESGQELSIIRKLDETLEFISKGPVK